MHHEKWDHNVMGQAFLEDYADLVNEKVARITRLSEDVVREL